MVVNDGVRLASGRTEKDGDGWERDNDRQQRLHPPRDDSWIWFRAGDEDAQYITSTQQFKKCILSFIFLGIQRKEEHYVSSIQLKRALINKLRVFLETRNKELLRRVKHGHLTFDL